MPAMSTDTEALVDPANSTQADEFNREILASSARRAYTTARQWSEYTPREVIGADGLTYWAPTIPIEDDANLASTTYIYGFSLIKPADITDTITAVDPNFDFSGVSSADFIVAPSTIDASFHASGVDLVPKVSNVDLWQFPLLTADSTLKTVYAKLELTYDANNSPQIVGDWDLEIHETKPAETNLFRDSQGTVTNGVYYRAIGRCKYVSGTRPMLWQDRIGPWEVDWCSLSNTLTVDSPRWALTTISNASTT